MSIKSVKLLLIFFFSLQMLNSQKISAEDNNENQIVSIEKNVIQNAYDLTDYLKNIPKEDYILGKGDVIRILFNKFQDPKKNQLENIYQVGNNGTINLPNINEIYVSGLTINELEKTLNKTMEFYIRDIDTRIEIIRYRPIRVYLNGEVSFPGIYRLSGSVNISENSIQNSFSTNQLLLNSKPPQQESISLPIDDNHSKSPQFFFPTLFDAIREAGGITFNSDLKNIKIKRINSITEGGGMKQTTINFLEVLKGEDSLGNIRIFDGDSITIPRVEKEVGIKYLEDSYMTNLNKKLISILIGGRVESPGTYTISSTNTLNEAIEISGGAKFLKGKVKLLRINSNGTFEKRTFKYSPNKKRGSYKNPFLKQGDIIVIGKSPFNITSEIIREFTSPFGDLISSYALFKAFQ